MFAALNALIWHTMMVSSKRSELKIKITIQVLFLFCVLDSVMLDVAIIKLLMCHI